MNNQENFQVNGASFNDSLEKDKAKIGWNWGAFAMPIQFGIGNKAYMCLLTLVPLLNIIWAFVSGFKGAEWAYCSGEFDSVKEFNASMRTWNRAGFVLTMVAIAGLVLYLAFFVVMIGGIISLAGSYS